MPQDWLRLEALPLPLLRIQGLMLRLLRMKRQGVLVAMRLEDMHVVHPMQDNTRSCVRCRHVVGIYPSGQAALKRWPRLEIQCARCAADRSTSESPPPEAAKSFWPKLASRPRR